tara:strand:+ start:30 stop:2924 length:2895 start_codon:yes stop_codon:yes gene_type:complete
MPRRFDFISPGVQLREVDQSQISPTPEEDGLLLIGRAPMGPAMQPVVVRNFADFREVFGDPVSGQSPSTDPWRGGNYASPMYAMYAAQAYLSADIGPVKFVRLLGEKSPDASTDAGEAGWKIADGPSATPASNKSAYGLFICPSGTMTDNHTGSLAAVFYIDGDATGVQLCGTPVDTVTAPASAVTASGQFVESISTAAKASTFRVRVGSENFVVNFDPTDTSNYIRKVLNTNPQKINNNANFGLTDVDYFLGETFEQSVVEHVNDFNNNPGKQYGIILALQKGASADNNWGYNRGNAQVARTPWFIDQKPNQQQLFRFATLSEGEEIQKKYKIAIEDLNIGDAENPPSFTVSIVNNAGQRIETHTGCTLRPGDANYVAKKIGDERLEWDSVEKRFNTLGLYENRSDYVRIEMASVVENGLLNNAQALPVGYAGPLRPVGLTLMSGSTAVMRLGQTFTVADGGTAESHTFVTGGVTMPGFKLPAGDANDVFFAGLTAPALSASFRFPALQTTNQGFARNSAPYDKNYLFGIDHRRTSTESGQDDSYFDIVRELPGEFTHQLNEGGTPPDGMEYSFTFTLDDLRKETNRRRFYFEEGSFDAGDSVAGTAGNTLSTLLTSSTEGGVRQFVAPLLGGRDGLDIFEADPFDNTNIGSDETTSYERATLEKALDIVSDPEYVSFDLLSIPGITDTGVTDRVLSNAAERSDHLAIIDLEGGYVPGYDGGNGVAAAGSVENTVNNLSARFVDNSYAAAYYPWVMLADTVSSNNPILLAPPSVAGIGAIAASEAASQPWFAPAGFNRGGLNPLGGPNGPRVTNTWRSLTKGLRDELYAARVNPIANFTAAGGIVVFGQKTLQLQQSALDRINVRRLMVFIKKRIGAVARDLLFDQAVDVTFNRFKSRATRILQSVKSNFGITEFKIVLDETTTTPDLIDQNIMYAQIFIKPARAIEFIAIDFVISRSGVEFE